MPKVLAMLFFNKEITLQVKSLLYLQLIPHITLCEPDILIGQPDVTRHVGNSSIPDLFYVTDGPLNTKFVRKKKIFLIGNLVRKRKKRSRNEEKMV